mmetsp:Transcript_36388/g.86411  ORF Transcript_36388/g.86411 Transcript_36388/m.86411 type:complete len:203 (-) Transcript_36388:442-1050(-)
MDQMLGPNVCRHTAPSLSSTAQRKGRGKREVVHITNCTKRGWLVNQNLVRRHPLLKLGDPITSLCISIQNRRVAFASKAGHLVSNIKGVIKVLCTVHADDWAQFLKRHRLVVANLCCLPHKSHSALRDIDACDLPNFLGRLANHIGVQVAILDKGRAQLLCLFIVQDHATTALEQVKDLVIDLINDHQCIFAGTDHTVIKGF